MNPLPRLLASATLLPLAVLAGCGSPAPSETEASPAAEHAHGHGHDHPAPTDFASAFKNLEAINTELSEAFVSGDIEEADHALHEAFPAVKALAKFAAEQGFDEAATKEVAEASEAILSAYDYLHGVHGGKEVDHGEVAGDIQAALNRLAAFAPKAVDNAGSGTGSGAK